MGTLMIYLTVFFTILSALMIGVAAGYLAILGILHAFGRHRQAIAPATAKIARVQA